MSDSNVLAAQKYLNAIYKGDLWVTLEENGNTGSLMMEGIVRAFQIENNVPNATGYLGPYTINVMKNLQPIIKMDPNDDSSRNVCLIQCALFCKGYNAGGITGIYYNTGVAAVNAMQNDAGLDSTGIIDWKVWAGLLSLNWFKKVSGGSDTIRYIQRQLNMDWSSVIGVQACDGIMSRNTALSVIGALQAAEGIVDFIDDISQVIFGPATIENCPVLSLNKNGEYIKFNKIAQYGLFFNGIKQTNFSGIFDSTMESNVSAFQKKYALLGVVEEAPGVIGISTMMSLLISKGDTDRLSMACDTSAILNSIQAKSLYESGYRYIGRYLTGTVGSGLEERSKALTVAEIKNITNAKLSIFPIYQDGGYYLNYFKTTSQGYYDAITAINTASNLGFKEGTTIYFAVDFDCLEYQADEYILPYFKQIKLTFDYFNSKNYSIGIYAPRLICTKVSEAGYTAKSFVADMSTGFSGNLGYPIPDNWAFDQFYEFLYQSNPSFDLDKVAFSGKDSGCSTFEPKDNPTDEELLYNSQLRYARSFLKGIDFLNQSISFNFNFESGRYSLGTFISSPLTISAEFITKNIITVHPHSKNTIPITWENGELSTDFYNRMQAVKDAVEDNDIRSLLGTTLEQVASDIKIGTMSFSYEYKSPFMAILSITAETDMLDYAGITGTVSCTIEYTIIIAPEATVRIGWNDSTELDVEVSAVVLILIFACVKGISLLSLGPIGLLIPV